MNNSIPIFVVGPPASGKTTLISNFIDKFDMYMIANPKVTVSGSSCAAGHYAGTKFDGADRIAYDKALPTIKYIADNNFFDCEVLFLDGDRVTTSNVKSFLQEYRPICIYLNIDMDTHIERSKMRGSNQNHNWVKGRFTKSQNFYNSFDPKRRIKLDGKLKKQELFSAAREFISKMR